MVLDEPISALDVSIQSQIVNLLTDLKDQHRLTYLFISHDLSVVEYISDRVAVMYLGEIIETPPAASSTGTRSIPTPTPLFSAMPRSSRSKKRRRIVLPGDVPSPINPPAGCRFHPRARSPSTPAAQRSPRSSTSPATKSVAMPSNST